MGPKLGVVPILLALAYVGLGYASWTLARVILGLDRTMSGWRVIACPVIAAFLMVAWDLSQDAVWATILRAWLRRDGGPYFGVPVSNFLGWYGTVYVIFQLFAAYLRWSAAMPPRMPMLFCRLAIVFYGICAAGNLLLAIPHGGPVTVADPTDAIWRVSDIIGVSMLVSLFVMGAFAVLAWLRLSEENQIMSPRVQDEDQIESDALEGALLSGESSRLSRRVS
jgi:hypothetical protein